MHLTFVIEYETERIFSLLFTVFSAFANLGPHPTRIECTNCQSQVTTNTKSSPGTVY